MVEKFVVLGNGSNIIFKNNYYDGTVILLNKLNKMQINENTNNNQEIRYEYDDKGLRIKKTIEDLADGTEEVIHYVYENGKLIAGQPIVNISILDEINMCDGTADINISTVNVETPYRYIKYYNDTKTVDELITETDGDTELLNQYFFTLKHMPLGNYTIIIRDANDVEYTKTAAIGTDLVSYEGIIHDFNTIGNISALKSNPILVGGYIEVSNVEIDELPDGQSLRFVLKQINENGTETVVNSTTTFNNKDGKAYTISVPSST